MTNSRRTCRGPV